MACYKCPYCNQNMAVTTATSKNYRLIFDGNSAKDISINVIFYKCPSCKNISIKCYGESASISDLHINILPQSDAIQFPEYVPLAIRQDYEEAYAILNLSPKASATLSRRCLQGMIRDFWGISKSRLIDEIDALKGLVSSSQWRVIDGVRRIGNIGAHMEKDINTIIDIEPDEAHKLIKLIELLIDNWYINRYETEKLYQEIISIDEDKRNIKNSH